LGEIRKGVIITYGKLEWGRYSLGGNWDEVKEKHSYGNFNQYLTAHYFETINKKTNFIGCHYERILHP